MEKDLQDYRKSYEKFELSDTVIPVSPILLFEEWFVEAEKDDRVDEANAMNLSTIGKDGFPKNRIVLLKKYNENGFTFYTNYKSEKGIAIQENPNVCLSFFWPNLERQVIIKGVATKTTEEDSSKYFYSRPRGSQLGALASNQSEQISSREELEEKIENLTRQFEGQTIPKPEEWGGYNVSPESYEFWQGRKNRLHDRILFSKIEEKWKVERLAP
ncbi:pyridoxamine 5'-phosphate oxidase [Salegentibacter sp. F188]|uniref:Pyridoxine/pyridoxamine 5'-phosphate oxidase n=1 Tax=Autumnicola patrickiae TaxID=3075591 RepID=A0ABU3E3W2_9FLAO|nr:pyridoxamine 5'-phosphate oxidase [Salegentibacter sp. F188]MDT0690679.1 pyridoxamine 5'-phosphate oxidase [Salegentibacter sp. F188]